MVNTAKDIIPVFDEMFSSSSSLQNVQNTLQKITFLLPDVNIYGINTVKQLLVSASLILLNTTLRILIVDHGHGKTSNILLTLTISYQNNDMHPL